MRCFVITLLCLLAPTVACNADSPVPQGPPPKSPHRVPSSEPATVPVFGRPQPVPDPVGPFRWLLTSRHPWLLKLTALRTRPSGRRSKWPWRSSAQLLTSRRSISPSPYPPVQNWLAEPPPKP